MKSSIVRTNAPFAFLILPILFLAVAGSLFADDTGITNGNKPLITSIILQKKPFSYPAGYMNRAPKEHRPLMQQFCANCSMDLSNMAQFQVRASVVNQFNLSSSATLSLEDDATISKAATPKKHVPIREKKKQKKFVWLRSL